MSRRTPVVCQSGSSLTWLPEAGGGIVGRRKRSRSRHSGQGVEEEQASEMKHTGESKMLPTKLIFIRRMKRLPICFMISLLGSCLVSTVTFSDPSIQPPSPSRLPHRLHPSLASSLMGGR